MGRKKIGLIRFHGGIVAEVQESLSVKKLEKKQAAFFASTDQLRI